MHERCYGKGEVEVQFKCSVRSVNVLMLDDNIQFSDSAGSEDHKKAWRQLFRGLRISKLI